MMSEVEAQSDGTLPPQVGLISTHETFVGRFDRLECRGLTDEQLKDLSRELKRFDYWRTRMENLARNPEMPPLVIARRFKHAFPPPCPVRFEPTPLQETDPALQALADRIREDADPSLRALLQHRPKYSSISKVAVTTIGLSLVLAGVLGAIVYSRLHSGQRTSFILAPLVLTPAISSVLLYLGLMPKNNWFLVPGGVVVRKAARRGPSVIQVLSPDNTTIAISGSRVMLIDRKSKSCHSRMCVPLEIAVLLAVWQSPIPAPDVSKLVDLQ